VPRRDRIRLDELVLSRGLAPSRSAARALIMAGLVVVEGQVSDKAGTVVDAGAPVLVKERPRFVSRAGDKLNGALETFSVDLKGASALDVGASTGGFVDCLLQRGANRVIALDVGRGQLDPRLRADARVHVIEGVNARYLVPGSLPWRPDFLTMDVSFISVTKVLPAAVACLAPQYTGVILIKPQFEAGPKDVGKGGIVRDLQVHRRVLSETGRFVIVQLGAALIAIGRSVLAGANGNVEYFFHLGSDGAKGLTLDTLGAVVDEAVTGPGQSGTEDNPGQSLGGSRGEA
jgi:23S rRNA (cytidine1920-2'-O)/16S rRNA (cytidine1409-2'-O)-methyltransferase